MSDGSKVFVGLDVHKDSISIAVAEAGQAAARFIGKIAHDVAKLLRQLERIGQHAPMTIVYEAGPTGYGLQRALAARGYHCQIIAPSLIPRRAGERVKTDRRDCLRLAELARAGELKSIWIPQPEDEAIRNLARAREDAVNARTQARHQLKAFLLRAGVAYSGKTAWSKAHARWLATLAFAQANDQIAFTEYCQAVSTADERVLRADGSHPPVDRRLALRADGACAAGVARHRCSCGDRPGGRDRRHRPVCASASAHGLSRPGPRRDLEW